MVSLNAAHNGTTTLQHSQCINAYSWQGLSTTLTDLTEAKSNIIEKNMRGPQWWAMIPYNLVNGYTNVTKCTRSS